MITIQMTQEQAKLVLGALGMQMIERTQRACEVRGESPVLAGHFDVEAAQLAAIYIALSTETKKEG